MTTFVILVKKYTVLNSPSVTDYCPERKQPSHPNCSEASTPWENWLAVPNIPEGYAVIKMHTTSRSKINLNRPGVDINEKRYWPVKIKHRSTGHTKWGNLHDDVPTVQTFVQETIALGNTTKLN